MTPDEDVVDAAIHHILIETHALEKETRDGQEMDAVASQRDANQMYTRSMMEYNVHETHLFVHTILSAPYEGYLDEAFITLRS